MSTNKTFTVEHRGCQLSYNVRGEGPPVLFIQGVGVHGDGWRPQVDELAARYRCLTFDNRGMNRSQPIGAPLSIEQMAEDALVLLKAQGLESAHVVGHSMGGLIAQHLALSARQRVPSLSLLCTFARGCDVTRPSPWMIWTGLRTRVGTRRQRRHAFLKMVLPPETLAKSDRDALAERLALIFGHDLADQPSVAMKQLSAMGRYDATSRLGELSGLPTLVVSAFHDRIARPELGRALAAGVPEAHYVEIADAAHAVPIEKRIVILGGGFAGVKCAQTLSRAFARDDAEIVLFNAENHFVFTPLLADVIGSSVNPLDVVVPFRQLLSGVQCRTEEVVNLDTTKGEVEYNSSDGKTCRLHYDPLVLACGNLANLHAVPGMADHAFPLRNIGDAVALRSHVMEQMEKAETYRMSSGGAGFFPLSSSGRATAGSRLPVRSTTWSEAVPATFKTSAPRTSRSRLSIRAIRFFPRSAKDCASLRVAKWSTQV